METDDLSRFEQDIEDLVQQLKLAFGSDRVRWFLHEQTDTLYIELSGLDTLPEDVIGSKAEPILEELDLDFEEIILMPYS